MLSRECSSSTTRPSGVVEALVRRVVRARAGTCAAARRSMRPSSSGAGPT